MWHCCHLLVFAISRTSMEQTTRYFVVGLSLAESASSSLEGRTAEQGIVQVCAIFVKEITAISLVIICAVYGYLAILVIESLPLGGIEKITVAKGFRDFAALWREYGLVVERGFVEDAETGMAERRDTRGLLYLGLGKLRWRRHSRRTHACRRDVHSVPTNLN